MWETKTLPGKKYGYIVPLPISTLLQPLQTAWRGFPWPTLGGLWLSVRKSEGVPIFQRPTGQVS